MSSRPATSPIAEANTLYSKATRAEHDQKWDTAFSLYIKAAELFLHVNRTSSEGTIRSSSKAYAKKALDRAENIKAARAQNGTGSDLTPVTVDEFSEHQQAFVLRNSGIINGLQIPAWNETESQSSNPYVRGTATRQWLALICFMPNSSTDSQPKLSTEQLSREAVWRRPFDALTDDQSEADFAPLLPQDVLQNIVSDCSVCASVSLCIMHHRRFGSTIGLDSLIPEDLIENSYLSLSGNYFWRPYFNGSWRRVAIDDNLPFDSSGSPLCMTTGSKMQVWPSLVEKAYMKLMGGYDFPGSNSSIDLHALAGWIPEHIEVKSPDFETEKAWHRVFTGSQNGACLLSLGTDQTPPHSSLMPLQPSHCYAVVDVTEHDDERLLYILDSSTGAKNPLESKGLEQQTSRSGTVQISWSEARNIFDGIYLSWDPTLFSRKLEFHSLWKPSYQTKAENQGPSNHRLKLKIHDPDISTPGFTGSEIWVLLTRHVIDTSRHSEFIALKVQNAELSDISLSNSTPGSLSIKGKYTNSTHILVRAQLTDLASGTLSILSSYDGPYDNVGFTVTAYSNLGVSWDTSVQRMPFQSSVYGTLSSKNSGGNCTYPTFMVNPQYHLRIYPDDNSSSMKVPGDILQPYLKTDTEISLQGSRDIPLHVHVVWSQGERIFELVEKDVAAHSGAYCYGLAGVTKDLPVGDYTIIASAFEPHYKGSFSLRVNSTHRFDLKAIAQEGAGMYTKQIVGTWDARTAVGGPSFRRYTLNPAFEMELTSACQIKIRLQLVRSMANAALNATIFPASNDSSWDQPITTSGPYSDGVSGVATPLVSLSPGKYALLPSTFSPGIQAAFRIIVYSTADVKINPKT